MADTGIKVAFRLDGSDLQGRYSEIRFNAFTLDVYGILLTSSSDKLVLSRLEDLKLVGCTEENFPESTDFPYLINRFQWIDFGNSVLENFAFSANNFKGIRLDIRKCKVSSNNNCGGLTQDEVDYIVERHDFRAFVESKYIDFSDFKTPVKSTLASNVSTNLKANINQKVDLYIRKNTYELDDSYFSLGNPNTGQFYSFEESRQYLDRGHHTTGNVFTMDISLDRRTDHYERSILTFFDVTGKVGGIFELFDITFSFILGYIWEKLFYRNVRSKLFSEKVALNTPNRSRIENYHESYPHSLSISQKQKPPISFDECKNLWFKQISQKNSALTKVILLLTK